MRNYLKWYKENLLAPFLLVGTFMVLALSGIPTIIANKLTVWLCNLLERNGVDLSRQLTSEEFAIGLTTFVIILIAYSFYTDIKEAKIDKSI